MKAKQFKLFQCCVAVKGIKNGIIIDFQRNAIHNVSNQLIDLLAEYSKKSIYELFEDFKASKKLLKKHIRYFIENELVIISDEIDRYPFLSTVFLKPAIIDTLCMELESFDVDLKTFLLRDVNELGINYMKLILKKDEINNLNKILSVLETSKIKGIVLYLEFNIKIAEELETLVINNPRISQVVFCNSIQGLTLSNCDGKFYFENLSLEELFDNKTIESVNDFVLNQNIYNEALQYNLMFNKSLFIDSLGHVKKYRGDLEIYGNIKIEKINNILENKDFYAFWNISKDQTEVCKDCEFRYICPDGRIPYKMNSENLYYKHKTACNY
ncbi:MAG: hypothetical protein RLZZ546_2719, partial [Bacteroidota bacterium]